MHELVQTYWRVGVVSALIVANGVLAALFVFGGAGSFFSERMYERSLAEFAAVEQNFNEIGKFFTTLAEERGGVYAFELLKRATLPAGVDVHLIGHLIGDELYKQQGLEGMKYCTHDFRNACSHSVVIGALLEQGPEVFDAVHAVCKQAPGGSGAYTMCFHGFGHGVLAYTGYDVPEAVDLCSRVGTEAYRYREYSECAGGITMEMVSGIHDREVWAEKKKEYMEEGDPLKLCRESFPDEVRSMCYVYITPELFTAAGAQLGNPDPRTFADAFAYCDAIPEGAVGEREACFGGLGKEFVVLIQDRDIRNLENTPDEKLALIDTWCAATEDEVGRTACVTYALNSLYWGGENAPELALRFCSLLSRDGDTAHCIDRLIANVSFFIQDAAYRTHFCAAVPQEFSGQCRARLQ
jgi:hypothetical protein